MATTAGVLSSQPSVSTAAGKCLGEARALFQAIGTAHASGFVKGIADTMEDTLKRYPKQMADIEAGYLESANIPAEGPSLKELDQKIRAVEGRNPDDEGVQRGIQKRVDRLLGLSSPHREAMLFGIGPATTL